MLALNLIVAALIAPSEAPSSFPELTPAGATAPAAPQRWFVRTVDPEGSRPSLQIDRDGMAHIAYYHSATGTLRYAMQSGTGWSIETIAPAQQPRTCQFLQLDRDRNPHIVYAGADGGIWYAVRNRAGQWRRYLVAQPAWGAAESLVLDSQGLPHVLYDLEDYLVCVDWTGSGWGSPRGTAVYPDLVSAAIDAQDRIHICVNDDSDLNYYRLDPDGGHAFTRFGPYYDVGCVAAGDSGPVLVIDGGENVNGLFVVRGLDPGPQLVPLPGDLFTAGPMSLKVARNADIHLLANLNGSMIHAVFHAGSWTSEIIAPGSWVGAMELDRKDRPAVAFESAGVQFATTIPAHQGPGIHAFPVSSGPSGPGVGSRPVLSAGPLPFRGGDVEITFEPPSETPGARTDLAIYDLNGRRVRTLVPESNGIAQRARWDGRDDRGSLEGPGVYFARAQSGGATHQLKIVRLP